MTNFSPGFLPPTPLGRAFYFGIQLRLKEQKSCYPTPRSASDNKDPVEGKSRQLYIQRHTHQQLWVMNTLRLTFLGFMGLFF